MSIQCKAEDIIVDNGEYNSDEADENIQLTLEDSGGESFHPNYHSSEQHSSSRQCLQHITTSGHHIIATTGKNSTKNIMENEKRMRREIANSNERRRMQSINAGFQSLRSLLPHHEGEKLSKAAILQQTAQYIIDLEREKTHLLSQNSQLKRHLGQHEIVGSTGGGGSSGGGGGGTEITNTGTIKKRKITDNVITIQTISDSSDEGLGSMSPEPVTLLTNATKTKFSLRQLEGELCPNQYIQREVIEHTDNVRGEEIELMNDPLKLQVVEINELPTVGQTQVVVCSSLEEDMQDDDVNGTIAEDIHDDIREEVIIKEETPEFVEVPSRLQPILEAAIKAEPKVEVERINATLTKIKEDTNTKDGVNKGNSRMYLTSTSRQNLETIVEAIRHLEGDHLFGDMVEQKKAQQKQQLVTQEVPLALTNKPITLQRKQLPVELSPFLQLKKPTQAVTTVTTIAAVQNATTQHISKNNSNNNSNSNNSIMGTISNSSSNISSTNATSTTTSLPIGSSILKAQLQPCTTLSTGSSLAVSSALTAASGIAQHHQQTIPQTSSSTVTMAATLKQCRPGVIVGKQISS